MNRPKSSNGRNTLIQNSGRHFVDRVSRCAGCPVRPRGVPALASMAYFPGAGSVPANKNRPHNGKEATQLNTHPEHCLGVRRCINPESVAGIHLY